MGVSTATALLISTGVGLYAAKEQSDAAKKAAAAQKAETDRQIALQEEQDALVAEQQAAESAEARERTARMATKRKGLLYEDETGVSTGQLS